jgi:hypothetical protein
MKLFELTADLEAALNDKANGADEVEYKGKRYRRSGPKNATSKPGRWKLVEAVVQASFGKRRGVEQDTGIEVPKGYDRFEVEHTEGEKSAWVIGIKGNTKTKISRADLVLARELVKAYNKGGKTDSGLKPISLMQAFGSKEMNVLHDNGITFAEKPYWHDFEEDGRRADKNIHQIALKKVEKLIGKIPEYSAKEVYGTDVKQNGMLGDVKNMPKEAVVIIKFSDGTRYLADTTQARSYIRMWQKIV